MRTDFVRKHAAHAAKIRRSKRQSKKNFVVYYIIVFDQTACMPDGVSGVGVYAVMLSKERRIYADN